MRKVLFVEDDRWLAESYVKAVQKAGYETDICLSGEEAMIAIDENIPDVIVADIMLDGHTVFALLNELQSHVDTRNIPVVVCTNLDTVKSEKVLLNYGVRRIVDKSTITPKGLIGVIEECLS